MQNGNNGFKRSVVDPKLQAHRTITSTKSIQKEQHKIAIDPHKRTAIKGFQKGGFTAFYSRLQHTI